MVKLNAPSVILEVALSAHNIRVNVYGLITTLAVVPV